MSPPTTTSPALARRAPAHRVVTPELLAAYTGAPPQLAHRFHRGWFIALRFVCNRRLVAVLDRVVVGRPDPLALEAAHHLRTLRQAELDGDFDHDPDHCDRCDECDELDGHCDADRDPPDIRALVVETMQRDQESERLLTGLHVARAVRQILCPARSELIDFVVLEMAAVRLLADVADLVRIGEGMVVDARPPALRELSAWGWWRAV